MSCTELETKCTSRNRYHHLLKTFWGWRDKQLPDATVIWVLPGEDMHVTTPGSALLFPALCAPTGELPPAMPMPGPACGNREAMMPTRTRTRSQNRASRINAERKRNQVSRQAAEAVRAAKAVAAAAESTQFPPPDPDEPPPF